MNKHELIETAHALGLETYNENDNYICVRGLNGHASVMQTDLGRNQYSNPATLKDFAEHIRMMGRDSLRLELGSLLSIMEHQ
jgi:hypothetical protein